MVTCKDTKTRANHIHLEICCTSETIPSWMPYALAVKRPRFMKKQWRVGTSSVSRSSWQSEQPWTEASATICFRLFHNWRTKWRMEMLQVRCWEWAVDPEFVSDVCYSPSTITCLPHRAEWDSSRCLLNCCPFCHGLQPESCLLDFPRFQGGWTGWVVKSKLLLIGYSAKDIWSVMSWGTCFWLAPLSREIGLIVMSWGSHFWWITGLGTSSAAQTVSNLNGSN
jgi:hypothetical protein